MFIIISVHMINKNSDYTIKIISKENVPSILHFVSELRIKFFRDYPYLYEGNLKEEMNYLNWFSKLQDTQIVVAYQGDKPIGFLTGTAFIDFNEHFSGSTAIFKNAGLNPTDFYYFSEIIILPEHRGKNISKKLFKVLENYATQKGYKAACLVNESYSFHPLKPSNYKSLDSYFQHLGYHSTPLIIHYTWPTLQKDGSSSNQEHSLRYWIKLMGSGPSKRQANY